MYWQVRWDFDNDKGPHVNVQFGSGPSSKFASRLHESQFVTPKKVDPNVANQAVKVTMAKIANDMNEIVDCNRSAMYKGKQEGLNWGEVGGKERAMNNLKEAWKAIANGPCT